jgi:predicted TIM-barrel fold metal-dependent hydrolase
MSERIDAYAHIGLPRFAMLEQYLAVMERHGIHRAVVAAADTCADLHEVSRTMADYPDRFRAVGTPLGETPAEMSRSFALQARHGFFGMRIFDRILAEQPDLLKALAENDLIPWVVGGPGLVAAAELLVQYLEGDPHRLIVAPHFGGAGDPALLEISGPVRDLFSHPRLLVIFSRHGAHDPGAVRAWARALITRCGWGRILFGSEFPVFFWRDESYQSVLDWVGTLGVPFDADAFYGGNAGRLLWSRPLRPARILADTPRKAPGEVALFGGQGPVLPEEIQHTLLSRYLGEATEDENYRAFVARVFRPNVG